MHIPEVSVHGFLGRVFSRSRTDPQVIVLPEGEDSRIQSAAIAACRSGIAKPVLLGDIDSIHRMIGGRVEDLEVVDPRKCPHIDEYVEEYLVLRRHRQPTSDEARKAVSSPLGYAAMAVHSGKAGGTLAGAVHTTADTIRTALQIIGRKPGIETVSSFFIMLADDDQHPLSGEYLFADCALNIDPTASQLASIGSCTAESAMLMLDRKPVVAFLSFSTAGSGSHERVDTVREAVQQLRREEPDLAVVGEIQLDAAVDPEIGKRKNKDGTFPGIPDVYVFPNLDAGNIGYKIAERFGRMKAVGPVLQGLNRPANDLSRGCSEDDILAMIAITSMQAAGPAEGVIAV